MVDKQLFRVQVKCEDTGETWEVNSYARDPEQALSNVVRRKRFVEWFMSEERFRFRVFDIGTSARRAEA